MTSVLLMCLQTSLIWCCHRVSYRCRLIPRMSLGSWVRKGDVQVIIAQGSLLMIRRLSRCLSRNDSCQVFTTDLDIDVVITCTHWRGVRTQGLELLSHVWRDKRRGHNCRPMNVYFWFVTGSCRSLFDVMN